MIGTSFKVVGLIPCRAGSKRLPRKAMLEINGTPLWEQAAENLSAEIGRDNVFVATDIPEILEQTFYKTAKRPAYLATDYASVTHVVEDFLDHVDTDEYSHIAILFPTNPHLRAWEIGTAVDMVKNENIESLRSYGLDGNENGLYIFEIASLFLKQYFYEVHTKAFPARGIEIHTPEDYELVKMQFEKALSEQPGGGKNG